MSTEKSPADSNGLISQFTKRLELEGQGLADVIKTEGFIIILALMIGVGLVMFRHNFGWLEGHTSTAAVFEHLGVGFIVSSISVFGFEWRSHARKVQRLSENLVNSIAEMGRMRETQVSSATLVKSITEVGLVRETLITAQGYESLDKALRFLLSVNEQNSPEHQSKLISSITDLVRYVARLQKVGIWVQEENVHFIADLLEKVVVQNSKVLSHLDQDGEYWFKVPPTGAMMADSILAAQMRALSQGDSYEVISHLTSWKGDQLKELQTETEQAISRGVAVKRIFNLLKIYEELVTPEDVRRILNIHLKNARDWGTDNGIPKYQVKVLFPDDVGRLASGSNRSDIHAAHFGIFTHGIQKLRVDVRTGNLADMSMSKDPIIIKSHLDLFNSTWSAIPGLLDESIVEKVFQFVSKHNNGSTEASGSLGQSGS